MFPVRLLRVCAVIIPAVVYTGYGTEVVFIIQPTETNNGVDVIPTVVPKVFTRKCFGPLYADCRPGFLLTTPIAEVGPFRYVCGCLPFHTHFCVVNRTALTYQDFQKLLKCEVLTTTMKSTTTRMPMPTYKTTPRPTLLSNTSTTSPPTTRQTTPPGTHYQRCRKAMSYNACKIERDCVWCKSGSNPDGFCIPLHRRRAPYSRRSSQMRVDEVNEIQHCEV